MGWVVMGRRPAFWWMAGEVGWKKRGREAIAAARSSAESSARGERKSCEERDE